MTKNALNPNIQPKNLAFTQINQGLSVPFSNQQFSANTEYPELLNQTVQDNYFSNRVNASKEANPMVTLGAGTVLWYAIAQGMDKFNPKCEGEYSKSILGKVGNWGDKFSKNTLVGRKLEQFVEWLKNGFNSLSNKSKIIYSLRHHSTMPEWHMAKTMGAGLHGFLAADTEEIAGRFIGEIKKAQQLEQLGVSQDIIDKFVETLKGKNKPEKIRLIQIEELKVLGVDTKKIQDLEKEGGIQALQKLAKELKAKRFGFKNYTHYESLRGKFLKHPDEIIKVLEKGAKNNVLVSIWRSENKLKNHLFGRTCTASEYLNKYKAAVGKGNDTALGRFMSKMFGYAIEGGTNRYAGGKIAVAMQAFIFGEMIANTVVAPKGEKTKTLIERLANDATYIIALPAGILAMHKVGGFKYAGLDVDGVTKYRDALKAFNEQVKNKAFANKAEYIAAKKELQKLLGTKNIGNPITKILQKIGSFINIGNERILSYRSNQKYNLNWFRKLRNGNIVGVPLRIIIPMMVISPFIAKCVTKCAHVIFGRPTKSVLDEDTSTKEEPQPSIEQQNTSTTNLLEKYKHEITRKSRV